MFLWKKSYVLSCLLCNTTVRASTDRLVSVWPSHSTATMKGHTFVVRLRRMWPLNWDYCVPASTCGFVPQILQTITGLNLLSVQLLLLTTQVMSELCGRDLCLRFMETRVSLSKLYWFIEEFYVFIKDCSVLSGLNSSFLSYWQRRKRGDRKGRGRTGEERKRVRGEVKKGKEMEGR